MVNGIGAAFFFIDQDLGPRLGFCHFLRTYPKPSIIFGVSSSGADTFMPTENKANSRHQENNTMLDLLEELESARLTRLTRTSFTIL